MQKWLGTLVLCGVLGSGGTAWGRAGPAAGDENPRVLMAAADAKAQKKIDKAQKALDKKFDQLRKKFEKRPEKKKPKDIEKAQQDLDKAIDKLEQAGADAGAVDAAKKKRDAFIQEVTAKVNSARGAAHEAEVEKLFAKLDKEYAKGLDRVSEDDLKKAEKKFNQAVARLHDKDGASDEAVAKWNQRRDTYFAALREKVGKAQVGSLRDKISDPPAVPAAYPAEAVPAQAPTWCDGVETPSNFQPSTLKLASDVNGLMRPDAMKNLVWFSCVDVEHDKRQKWVQAVRQSISNEYALTNADNEKVMKFAARLVVEDQGKKKQRGGARGADRAVCQKWAPLSSGTLEKRLTRALERIAIGCGNALSKENRESVPRRFADKGFPYWVVDIDGGFGSELAKSTFVADVLTDLSAYGEQGQADLRNYTNWVLASAVSLDDKVFRQELAGMGLGEEGEVDAILWFSRARGRYLRQGKFVEAAAKKNKQVKAMFIEGPKAARGLWKKDAAQAKKLFSTVLALEDKLRDTPGGMSGCAKTLYPDLQKWVAAKHKKNKDVALGEIRFDDYVGYQLAYGLTVCGYNDPEAPVMDQVFGYYLDQASPQRGPVTASYAGMLEGYNDARADNKAGGFDGSRGGGSAGALPQPAAVPVQPPDIGQSMHGITTMFDPRYVPSAVVKAVKKKGDVVEVSFVTTSWQEPVLACTETNKISKIRADGTIQYRMKCKKTGTRTVKNTPQPITVPAWTATGIKAGALLVYTVYPNQMAVGRGWPLEVYASKARKKRTALLGVKAP